MLAVLMSWRQYFHSRIYENLADVVEALFCERSRMAHKEACIPSPAGGCTDLASLYLRILSVSSSKVLEKAR